jgi:hypothetical protein
MKTFLLAFICIFAYLQFGCSTTSNVSDDNVVSLDRFGVSGYRMSKMDSVTMYHIQSKYEIKMLFKPSKSNVVEFENRYYEYLRNDHANYYNVIRLSRRSAIRLNRQNYRQYYGFEVESGKKYLQICLIPQEPMFPIVKSIAFCGGLNGFIYSIDQSCILNLNNIHCS